MYGLMKQIVSKAEIQMVTKHEKCSASPSINESKLKLL